MLPIDVIDVRKFKLSYGMQPTLKSKQRAINALATSYFMITNSMIIK